MNQRAALKWVCSVIALIGAACGTAVDANDEQVGEAEQHLDMSRFGSWEPLPTGNFNGDLALVNADGKLNRLVAYGTGTDGAIWLSTKTQPSAPWSAWASLGGWLYPTPAATMFKTGTQHTSTPDRHAVVGRGSDQAMWISVTDAGSSTYRPWSRIPGSMGFVSAPAVAWVVPYLIVVGRTSDNVLHWTRNNLTSGFSDQGWSAWRAIPYGVVQGNPSATSSSAGWQMTVAARGMDNGIWFTSTSDGDSWSAWKRVQGGFSFSRSPAVSRHGPKLEVTALAGNRLYIASVDPTFGSTDGWRDVTDFVTDFGAGTAADPTTSQTPSGLAGRGRFGLIGRSRTLRYYSLLWEY